MGFFTMHYIRSFLLILLALVLLCAGCAPKEPVDVIVARVGDAEITRQEFRVAFNRQFAKEYYAGGDFSTNESVTELQDSVINNMIQTIILEQKYAGYGIALTEEEEASLVEANEKTMTNTVAEFEKKAQEEGAADISARAMELFLESVTNEGYGSLDAYAAYNLREERQSALKNKLFDLLSQEVTLTDEEAKKYFDAQLVIDTKKYASSTETFEQKQYEYESSGGMPPLYAPEGFIRVKHILVEKIELAEQLVQRLQNGEDFDTLMDEYGADPGMKSEPMRTLGYLLCENTSFIEEFKKAALALEAVNDITAPVESTYGYHIIKKVDNLESGPFLWDDVKAYYTQFKLKELRTQYLSKVVSEWMRQEKIEIYSGRVRDIGITT